MTTNIFRSKCCEQLQGILRKKETVKDSALLQAYACFCAMKESGLENLHDAYKAVYETCKQMKYTRAFISGLELSSYSELSSVSNLFLQVSFAEFLRFAVPEFAGDVSGVVDLLHYYFGNNILLCIHHLMQVKLTQLKIETDLLDSDSYEDVISKMFNAYCNIEKCNDLRMEKNTFIKLYRALNLYSLDANERTPSIRVSDDNKIIKSIYAALAKLRDELGFSKEQIIDFIYLYFVCNENNPALIHQYKTYNFTLIKDEGARKKSLSSVMKNFASLYPLECLCAALLLKKTSGVAQNLSEDIICENDVTLENGLIFSLFSSSIYEGIEKTSSVAIFFPSPFFVRKWLRDPITKNFPVTFIFENDKIKEIIDCHYFQGTYAKRPNDNVNFLTYNSWVDQVSTSNTVEFDKALLFACNWDIEEQDKWYHLLKTRVDGRIEIFSLISSYEFEKAYSPFSSELTDDKICIRTLALIPQGINNSSRPRRKIFLQCSLLGEDKVSENVKCLTRIYTYTLNTDLKTQALKKMRDTLEVEPQNLIGLYDSVRELFNAELLKRRASGRTKNAAFSHEFTPDITFWCSKSYPKGNLSRPRLEAYVCLPASQKKVLQGYMDRGERVDSTRKRVTRLPDESITAWLEEEYPFSIMQPRHTSEKLSEIKGVYKLKPAIDIREEIINVYAPLLIGQDIALKTLCYLHPDLEDKFSGDDYRLLKQIVNTEIGYLRLSDLTADKCETLLARLFNKESSERLFERYIILSAAVDQAVKYNYCESNPLQSVIKDVKLKDKLFAQVRRLAKKNFTLDEMDRAFKEIKRRIDAGKYEYIGVLIRLLTGLESNIVCALKIKDFVEISEYGIYQFNITCQLTNDGSEIKGFDSLEDYRNIPSMSVLTDSIKEHVQMLKNQLPDSTDFQNIPLVTTKDFLKKAKSRYKYYQPRKLEQLCKEIIDFLDIEDHIIEIPAKDGGTKETNLNHYGGDFFRKNFQHWALETAKMEVDEVQYILGNKPTTTFGRYYCDYLNDASQLMMFVKLQRWDVILDCPDSVTGNILSCKNSVAVSKEIFLSGRNPLHLYIELIVRSGVGTVHVNLYSKYGLNIVSTPVELIEL